MRRVEIYDPPMCCSTGVCGTNVDPVLLEFAAAMKVMKEEGFVVERYNLSQEPAKFIENKQVRRYLEEKGQNKLPVIFIDNELVYAEQYPSKKDLFAFLGIEEKKENDATSCSSSGKCCP